MIAFYTVPHFQSRSIMFAVIAALLLAAGPAESQTQIKPKIMILFDTSGSMAWNIDKNNTRGDGSNDAWPDGRRCCPGTGGSRIYLAKEAMTRMIMASGDIEFALMKFSQRYETEGDGYQSNYYYDNQESGELDKLRYEGIGANFGLTANWLCVDFHEGNSAEILMWMDHHEYSSTGSGQADTSVFAGPYNDFTEQELRADGSTPLGEALRAAYNYLLAEIELDPVADCRPYSVIVLTDGDKNGTLDPVTWTDYLHEIGTREPTIPGDVHIDTWVIGLAHTSDTLDEMADVGGCHYDPAQFLDRTPHASSDCDDPAGHAFWADSQDSLSSILYQIVAGSILIEVCNEQDDDCDDLIDEGFELYCDRPDNHPAEDLCDDPGETECDGIDNNCDGKTDEDLTPPNDNWTCSHSQTDDPYEGMCTPGTWQCQGSDGWICMGGIPSTEEDCNKLDDDCDGQTDENAVWPSGPNQCGEYSGRGECDYGHYECQVDGWVCVGEGEPSDEGDECDGLDNDCDGQTDEGIFQLCGGGPPGHENDGICKQVIQYCDIASSTPGHQVWIPCEGNVDPGEEICNGLDDDCDGETDVGAAGEGIPCGGADLNGCPGLGGTCPDGRDQGACQEGSLACQGGVMQCAGSIAPVSEGMECDGLDNDCDGKTDEGIFEACGGGPPGHENDGICFQGRAYCDPVLSSPGNPVYGDCIGDISPQTEQCDGKDNDCDGQTDEEFPTQGDPCGGAPGPDPDEGACRSGDLECVGAEIHCSDVAIGPANEECNGLDDDCDGETDEAISRECGGNPEGDPGQGVCQEGIQYCDPEKSGPGDPVWKDCLGSIEPADGELCNDLDDDCDGETDEEPVAGVDEICGECNDGHTVCEDGHLVCHGDSSLGYELCDGLDNNCDSLIDEGLIMACGGCDPALYPDAECTGDPNEGECQQGISKCEADAGSGQEKWGDCQGGFGPMDEICDDKDNDCDGITDEEHDIANAGVQCLAAEGICEEAWWRCAENGSSGKSLKCCADMDLSGGCVAPQGAVDEECNGLDDDCDGDTDEDLVNTGQPCGNNLGICKSGTVQCVCDTAYECGLECVGATTGADEVCNGLDDDCDGRTDEPEDVSYEEEHAGKDPTCINSPSGQPTGICEEGEYACVNGDWECNANLPVQEICDGKDNDCDGETDEKLEVDCPGDSVCVRGECAEPCVGDEMSCPQGKVCEKIDGSRVCITDVCNASSSNALLCADNPYWCDKGFKPPCHCEPLPRLCVDDCHGKDCPDGYVCVPDDGGRCHSMTEDDCHATGCSGNRICVAGECVDDPCAGVSCSAGKYVDTVACKCVSPCKEDHGCPSGCFHGKCVDDSCAGVVCDPGFSCKGGNCVKGGCWGVICEYYEICISNGCIEDPCWNVECPNGYLCVRGSCYETAADSSSGDADVDADADTDFDVDTDTNGGENGDGDGDQEDSSHVKSVMATGMGGCICGIAPGSESSGADWLLMLVLGGIFAGLRFGAQSIRWLWVLCVVLVALLAGLGCQVQPYKFGQTQDGDTGGDADSDSDGDTDIVECATDNVDNDCDGVDDDCDGFTDEDIDTASNPYHCGECNNACEYDHAFGQCAQGVCQMGDCASYWYDINGSDTDGCEYFCQPTSALDECNGVDLQDTDNPYVGYDDNCNGTIDEDVDFASDPFNCGLCGHACYFSNAEPACKQGKCVIGNCEENFRDIDSDPANGCEYHCVFSQAGELCNNLDDDCDGQTDEGNPDSGAECYTGHLGCKGNPLVCTGTCAPGSEQCIGGVLKCEGQIKPKLVEECNGLDDDCDGQTDENLFRSCGGAAGPNPFEGTCHPGYQICDPEKSSPGDPAYTACIGSQGPADVELCNNLDDDCDGQTDEDADDPKIGLDCGLGICAGQYECIDGTVQCNEGDPDPGGEKPCDGLDNDCDGLTDIDVEITSCGGAPGPNPNVGICRAGTYACEGPVIVCNGNVDPECGPVDGCDVCDNQDNDCDGQTDEDAEEGAACGTPCNDGTMLCLNGVLQCMNASMPEQEQCDGQDNDCDGETDEDVFRFCGGGPPGHENDGICQTGIQYCDPAGSTPETPAWLPCQGNQDPGTEICDAQDNNCNGQTDEDLTAPDSGICDMDCPGAKVPFCNESGSWDCDYDCDTQGGNVECDIQGNPRPVETNCDSHDGNCDGQTDEAWNTDNDVSNCGGCNNDCTSNGVLWPQGSVPEHVESFGCYKGSCVIHGCQDTWWDDPDTVWNDCDYECTQTNGGVEKCDGKDNDCDGLTDDGVGTTEVCNDIDDDCNGLTDDMALPPWECKNLGECADLGEVAQCDGANQTWICNYEDLTGEPYNKSIQIFEGEPVAEETLCDGKDNDCDGWTDESFSELGVTCFEGQHGACVAEGIYLCREDQGGVVCCDPGNPGAICETGNIVAANDPQPEVCNGLDDDCDNETDEGAGEVDAGASADSRVEYIAIVDPSPTPLWSFDIFVYEASRPDADQYTVDGGVGDNKPGTVNTAACSVEIRIPWTMVSKTEAEQACWKLNASGAQEAGGWDLCSAAQWQRACEYGDPTGTAPHEYPYGDTYDGDLCNGYDYSADWDCLIGCGEASSCLADWAATGDLFDLSGNAEEWTRTPRTIGPDTLYEIRGGSYNDVGGGMTCDFDFWAAEPDLKMPNLGFRCCRGDEPL